MEPAADRPARDLRVCFFGDSFTLGVGDPTGAGWVGLVAAAARSEGHDLTAYNLGVRRDTSVDIARRWRSEARERLKDGDLFGVVFAVGTNDVAVHHGRPRVPRARSLTLLADMLDDAHTALWSTLVIGPPSLQDRQDNARAAELATGMAQVCADRTVPFLNVIDQLAADPVWQREVAAGDACHPSTRGYEQLAALVRTMALPWLADLCAHGERARALQLPNSTAELS
jgi:acyl-CoA thioesterase-1